MTTTPFKFLIDMFSYVYDFAVFFMNDFLLVDLGKGLANLGENLGFNSTLLEAGFNAVLDTYGLSGIPVYALVLNVSFVLILFLTIVKWAFELIDAINPL